MFRIDSHHHLWQYNDRDYGWIHDEMTILRRNFTPLDLKSEMDGSGIDFAIAVQASQSLNETRFLLSAAKQNPFIKGVVGWVPLIDEEVEMDLEHFASDKRLRGVRHVLHDEPDDHYMLRDDFNRGMRLLLKFDLVYDLLIFERHLPQTIQFVDQHPDQRFVVDHLGKPRVGENEMSPWREQLFELAKRPNVYCKLSGLATEASHTAWTEAQLGPFMDVVLDAFGPARVMFGSDWPVCLLAIPYRNWVEIVMQKTAHLTPSERARVWGGTAAEAYGLVI